MHYSLFIKRRNDMDELLTYAGIVNKLCVSRHNMPPPLSSLGGRRNASRSRADRA